MATGQQLGAKKRFKGWSKKRISEHMARIATNRMQALTPQQRKVIGAKLLISRGQKRRVDKTKVL